MRGRATLAPSILAVALAVALALASATTVFAMQRPHIQVQLQGEPRAAQPGIPYSGRFDVTIGQQLEVYGFRLEGDGWRSLTLRQPTQTDFRAGDHFEIEFTGTPSDPVTPLELSFESRGQLLTRSIDLSASHLQQITQRALAEPFEGPAPATTPATTSEAASHAVPEPATPRRYSFEKPLRATAAAKDLGKGYNVTISGRVVYTDQNGLGRGADGVTVHCYDQDWDWDEHLGSGVTNSNGWYSFTVFVTESAPDLYVEYHAANNRIVMEEDSLYEDNYVWVSAVDEDHAGGTKDFGTVSPGGSTGQRVLHILTTLTRAWRWLDDYGYDSPAVDCQFPEVGSNPWTFYDGELHVAWQHGWEEKAFVHEYGHHWVHSFAFAPPSDYDNGICDTPNLGHCVWCQETDEMAWNEGFPNWLSQAITNSFVGNYGDTPLAQYSFETTTASCTDSNGMSCPCDPLLTEGYFAAALLDISDGSSEGDNPNLIGFYDDTMALGSNEILYVADQFQPTNPMLFLFAFKGQYPQHAQSLWSTAANNGYQIDIEPPGVVQNIGSTSHVLSSLSSDGTVDYVWGPAPDDASGSHKYRVSVTAGGPADPGIGFPNAITEAFTTPQLAPGDYWINIRAMDAMAKWSTQYASWGPVQIREPYDADFAPAVPVGWNYSVVPREFGNSTLISVPDPVVLMGDQPTTWWNAAGKNIGELAPPSAFLMGCRIDGKEVGTFNIVSNPGPGQQFAAFNRGPINVRPGRHTVELFLDSGETVAENTEGNNWSARQWIWRPSEVMNSSTPVMLAAPPHPDGGWENVSSPPNRPPNCDGLRMSMVPRFGNPRYFAGIAIHARTDGHNYDASLEYETTAPWNGFGGGFVESQRAAGLLDAVIVNGVVDPHDTWDVGVINTMNMTPQAPSQYFAGYAQAEPIAVGETQTLDFTTTQMMVLRQFVVGPPPLGWAEVHLEVADSTKFTVLWLNSAFTQGTLLDHAGMASTGLNGEAHLGMQFTAPGTHCLVVYRDPLSGESPVQVTLSLSAMYSDADCSSTSGWEQPLLPSNDLVSTGEVPPFPLFLLGDGGPTYFNLQFLNNSPSFLPALQAVVEVDGVPVSSTPSDVVAPFAWAQYLGQTPAVIGGGRHTMALRLDPANQLSERREDNNDHAAQWVWTPPVLTATPVVRPLPPVKTAGWEFIPETAPPDVGKDDSAQQGEPEPDRWFNCDGFATPNYATPPAFAAVVTVPSPTVDVDVSLHPHTQNATDGFAEPLVTSEWADDASDFVLISFANAPDQPYDAGVVRSNAGASAGATYSVQRVESSFLTQELSGDFGPFDLAGGRALRLHEVHLLPGIYTFQLQNVSGSVDWGMSLYAPVEPFQSKSDYLQDGAAWVLGAGLDEAISVMVEQPGAYCLAVWKKDAMSLNVAGQYTLAMNQIVSSVDETAVAPLAHRLAGVRPNPFNPRTTVSFELASDAAVAIAVYDARGARVRSLVAAHLNAGRKEVIWDGRDDRGQGLASGSYFIQFVAGEIRETRKVTLVK